jgi:inositol-1,3,4-trisphosphate 5/6-kinase/inositol-tetrakisphosphate 1-kinase
VSAKPLVADGSATSHAMFLLFNTRGLNKLKPPMVLQEFVNHGGVIFKVYVVGKYIKCVRRKSLPDIHEDQVSTEEPLPFSQISNMVSGAIMDENVAKAELPPANFIADVANGLREALGLRLFNFDVIKDSKVGTHFHVIDINYFPGYAKMPAYETVLTDFLLDLRHEKASMDSNPDTISLASIASKLGVPVEEV